jgi:hypothetical protein
LELDSIIIIMTYNRRKKKIRIFVTDIILQEQDGSEKLDFGREDENRRNEDFHRLNRVLCALC